MYKKPVKVKASSSQDNNNNAEVKLNDRYTDEHPLEDVPRPGPHDVLYGRGGGTNHHSGNKKFRDLIDQYKPQYLKAKRLDKPGIAMMVVTRWRMLDPPGRFLKSVPGNLWSDVGDAKAREKTSQALREKAAVLRQCLGFDRKAAEFAKVGSICSSDNYNHKSAAPPAKKTVSLSPPLPVLSASGIDKPVAAKRHTSNEIEPVKSSKLGKKPAKLSMRDHSLALNHLPGASTRTSARKVFDGPAGGAFEEISEVECLDAIFDHETIGAKTMRLEDIFDKKSIGAKTTARTRLEDIFDNKSSGAKTTRIVTSSTAGSLDYTENLISQSTSPPTAESSLNAGDIDGVLDTEYDSFSPLADILSFNNSPALVEKKQVADKGFDGNIVEKNINSDSCRMKPPLARPQSVKSQGREYSTSSKDTFPPRSALRPIPRPKMLQVSDRDVSACTIASELSGDFSALKVDDFDLEEEFGDDTPSEFAKINDQRQPVTLTEPNNENADDSRKEAQEPLHETLKPEARPTAKRDNEQDIDVPIHEENRRQRFDNGRFSEQPPSYYDDGNGAELYMPPSRLLPPMHRASSVNMRAYERDMLNDRCTSIGTFDGRAHSSLSGRSISSGSAAAAYERAMLNERANSLGTFVPPNVARSESMLSSSSATSESREMLRQMLSEQARNGFDPSADFMPSSYPRGIYDGSFSRSNSYGISSYPSALMSSGRRISGMYYDDPFIANREMAGHNNRHYDYDPHLAPMPSERFRYGYGVHPLDRQESTSSWKSYPSTYESSQTDQVGVTKQC
mmetsp:Transcript_1915/g.2827  ORF Transcript_1915/g.2827 Transcript_1915/m.2827 type:complete len:791 (-) Transcript_1915:2033-4405(-)|eukprot:CAMPEP_0116005650 /NCGR_PEP_ID=MMETSP0321-20121206/1283_1 /TAXON_ID=163516 /ORGANISM="Leptocylindrus danicus var. danicus, Strain B650" /LENGTH=790 /DNA_ID=CAMNT_0003474101 /DNA_START=220 /DNA_END=2592 /DNA_ORIENTATION=+